MVKKLQKTTAKKTAPEASAAPLAGAVKESAQQIWLAGLGAFSKAQQEGSKVFEGLVKEGLSIQRKTQAVAEERIADATNRMTTMANGITSKATGQWDKLETIFEDRVSRTLNKLGVPTAQDIDALIARIDELNRNVQKLQPKAAPKTAAKATTATPDATPAATKTVAKKSVKPATKAVKTIKTAPKLEKAAEAVADTTAA